MNRLSTSWILVIIGITFNIGSAIITHYYIGLNNQALNELELKANQLETMIDSAWRNKTEIERKQEFLLLLMTRIQDETDNAVVKIKEQIVLQLEAILSQHRLSTEALTEIISFGTINTISEQAKQKIINDINDTYLEKVEIDSLQLPLKEQNSLLLTVAIFLQITGLILVLARDMRF